MGILSKTDVIKRIMIGEMLINPDQREVISQNLQNSATLENFFKEYFEKLALKPEILGKRRLAIKNYVEKKFLEKTPSEIRNVLMQDLNDFIKDEDKILFPIFIDDVKPECLRTANYDLRLGADVYVSTEKVPGKLNVMGKNGTISIEPGEFGILMSHEYIFVPPDLMGFISIRLTHKQKGLVNISGFHVDPGFYGRLVFAVFNAGPNDVPLRYKEPVFMIMFEKLIHPIRIGKSRWHGMEDIPVETLSGLRGTSVSVRSLDERIKRLEITFPLIITGVIGVMVAVITWVLTHW